MTDILIVLINRFAAVFSANAHEKDKNQLSKLTIVCSFIYFHFKLIPSDGLVTQE